MTDEWFSVLEAGKKLGVGQNTIYRLINSGQLTAFKIGRVLRLRGVDIAAYLDSARVKPGDLAHLTWPPPAIDLRERRLIG